MNTSEQQKLAVLNKLVEHYGHQNWWTRDNWVADAVSMILIQQSTQANVMKALDNLAPYLSLASLNHLSDETLQSLIRPSGFFRQKTQYLRA